MPPNATQLVKYFEDKYIHGKIRCLEVKLLFKIHQNLKKVLTKGPLLYYGVFIINQCLK